MTVGPTIFVPKKTPISPFTTQKISPADASILVIGSTRSHLRPSHGPRQHERGRSWARHARVHGLDDGGANGREGPCVRQDHIPEAHGPRQWKRVCHRARGLSCLNPDEAPHWRSGARPHHAPLPPTSPHVIQNCRIHGGERIQTKMFSHSLLLFFVRRWGSCWSLYSTAPSHFFRLRREMRSPLETS
jgi:hypothetical protein